MERLRKVRHIASEATLELWDTYKTDRYGKCVLRYEFTLNNETLFSGSDFACSPMCSIDSDEAVLSLLGFLTLRPGDTDQEYFEDYTESQLAWANSGTCENMQCDISALEGGDDDIDPDFCFNSVFEDIE